MSKVRRELVSVLKVLLWEVIRFVMTYLCGKKVLDGRIEGEY